MHKSMVEYNGSSMMGVEPPPSAAAVKRAVLKFAPRVFSVEVLPPSKHGNAYSYGLRIFPTTPSKPDSRSQHSDRSWSSDYEVWRRWEDCLDFQEVLEDEYAQMAKDKRRRLKNGKGVKKDGIYVKSDFAASWDSLPAGPDYQDIATDIHAYLPKLSKKGCLFRPSQSTIKQRGQEFEKLIEALWMDEPPTLIKELRETSKVRDFFGFWRRDQERLRKLGIPGPVLTSDLYGTASIKSGLTNSPGSISRSSFFPSFFLKPRPDDLESICPSFAGTGFPESVRSPSPTSIIGWPPQRQQDSSGDDASCPSTPRTDSATPLRFIFDSMDNLVDSPVKVSRHEAQHRPSKLQLVNGPGSPMLSPIGESPRILPLLQEHELLVPPQPGRKRSGTFPSTREHRNCRILPGALNSAGVAEGVQYVYANSFIPTDDPGTPSPRSPYGHRTSRSPASESQFSFATVSSAPSDAYSPTIFSVEGSAASSRPSSYQSTSSQPGSRAKCSAPIPEEVSGLSGREEKFGVYPAKKLGCSLPYRATRSSTNLNTPHSNLLAEIIPPQRIRGDGSLSNSSQVLAEEADEILDTFFANMSFPNVPEQKHTSGRESILYPTPQPNQFPIPFQHRPPGQYHLPWSPIRSQHSPVNTRVHSLAPPSAPPASTLSPIITIKAIYGEAIVVIKIERTCNLAQFRQRIYDKFMKQETVLISECFILGYVNSHQLIWTGRRQRTLSTSTIASISSIGTVDPKQLSFIVLEPEWKSVLKTCGPKLTLILLDP